MNSLTKIPAANRPFVINSDQGIVEKATTAGKKRKVSARDEGANGEDGDLDDGPVGKKARGKKAIEEEKAQKVEEVRMLSLSCHIADYRS